MEDAFEDHCWQGLFSPEELSVYAAYRREPAFPRRPAVLAVDLYRAVFAGGNRPVAELVERHPSSCGEYAWAALEPLRRLLDAARSAGLPIVYTTGEDRPQALPQLARATRRGRPPVAGELAFQPEVAPQPGDLVVYKQRASAFFGTPLDAHLRRLGVDGLLVCGETTSGCVRASAVDAYSLGFQVCVVEEATFDRNLLTHRVNLFDLHHKYADVMHLADVLERLRGGA